MFNKFYPKEYVNSTYEIDFKKLYNKGFKSIIFDIDNTLVPHGAPATKESKELINKLQKIGFKCFIMSNNKEYRVKSFADELNLNYIYKANKPFKKNYLQACKTLNSKPNETIFIGDQLFTDIYGANKCNLYSILTMPIDKQEEIQIVLKRFLEKPILYFYKKQKHN